jgi:hypothetical protein
MSVDQATVRKLQEMSCLHVTVIAKANLQVIRAAYDQDPTALTEELMDDAFRHASFDVIQFLVGKRRRICTSRLSELLATAFLGAISTLASYPYSTHLQRLKDLCQAYPQAISNPTLSSRYCPMRLVMNCDFFPPELMEFMVEAIPHNTLALNMLGKGAFMPMENSNVRRSLRVRTDPGNHYMAGLKVILTKLTYLLLVESPKRCTETRFAEFIALLFQPTNFIKQLHLHIRSYEWSTPPQEPIVLPANSPIVELSLLFAFNQRPFFDIISWLGGLNYLERLEIYVPERWKVPSSLLFSLCELLRRGRLKYLDVTGKTQTAGLYLPLLEAADKSDSLVVLRLHRLGKSYETVRYQEHMLSILKTNTKLEEVVICGDSPPKETPILQSGGRRMKQQVTRFLELTEGDAKQRQMDMKTLLNRCGRGKVRGTATSRGDFIDLVTMETLQQKLSFSDFLADKATEESFIDTMRYGLLRETPSIWLVQVGGRTVAVSGRKRKCEHKRERNDKRIDRTWD